MSVLREAHTNTAPGLITLLPLPSMPAVFWMAHGPHAHRVGSCSPAAAVQQSAADASHRHLYVRSVHSAVHSVVKDTGGRSRRAEPADGAILAHDAAGTSLKLMSDSEIVFAACSDASILQ